MKRIRVLRRAPRAHSLRVPLPRRDRSRGAGPIRVAIISRHRLIREAIGALLGIESGIEIVGDAEHEAHAVDLIHRLKPNVVLVDSPPDDREGLDLLRAIHRDSAEPKLLLLTSTMDESLLCWALTAGANGYVSKGASVSELRTAIRGVHDGDAWVDRKVLLRWLRGEVSAVGERNAATEPTGDSLTAREREILGLLASGGTNKEIARALFISDKTVKTHLNNIFRKLRVTRRLQAVLYAVRHGYFAS